jgi:DNA-binding winged helix-turn-helix (wHTH) protein/Tol biopolymer transport system component
VTVCFGPFVLDGDRRQLFENGAEVHLSPKAYELLTALVEQRPRAVSKADLQARLWPDTFVQESNLTVLVSEIRNALHEAGRGGRYIRTVHGFGYAFEAEVERKPPATADAHPAGDVAPSVPASSLPGPGRAQRTRRWFSWAIPSAALVLALSTIAWRGSPWPLFRSDASLKLAIALPADLPLAAPGRVSPAHDRPALAISRDGRWLSYVCQSAGATQLCLRDMEGGTVSRLAGTEGAHTPFFSPDGAAIGFFADRRLKTTSRFGGAPTVLADAPNPWGATWGPDGLVYFSRNEGEGIFSVSAGGGPVRQVIPASALMPEFDEGGLLLGGGRFVRWGSTEPRRLVPGAGAMRVFGSEYLLYTHGTSLMAVRFDRDAASTIGPALPLATGLRTAFYSVAQFALSDEGTLVYVAGNSQGRTAFAWVDRTGHRTPASLQEDEYHAYAVSPDGTRLAFGRAGAIWVQSIEGVDVPVRVTPRDHSGEPTLNVYPRWSPDGRRLFHVSRPSDGPAMLMSVAADGSEPPVEIWRQGSTGPTYLYPMAFTPDRRKLSVFGPNGAQGFDIYELPAGPDGEVRPGPPLVPLLGGRFAQVFGQVSPDGRWLLFMSDASGIHEVYVTSYPRPGAVHRVSDGHGREPMWNPSRDEIVYLSGTSVYGVAFRPGAEWDADEPQLLFSGPYPDTPGFGYAMSPDGRFLLLENARFFEPATTLNVVTNVQGELRRQVRERER